MIFNVDWLRHILDLVAHPLATVSLGSTWSEGPNATRQVLVLRSLATALQSIEVEVILVASAADAPLVAWVLLHLFLHALSG